MRVVVEAAVSVDGRLVSDGRAVGPDYADRIDRRLAAADAVLVDVETVLAGDPTLTVAVEGRRVERLRGGRPATPACVVLDPDGRLPTDAAVLDEGETVAVVADVPDDRRDALAAAGVTVVDAETATGSGARTALVDAAFDHLADRNVDRLLVTCGGWVTRALLADAAVDEMVVFVRSAVVGGPEPRTLVDGSPFENPLPLEMETVERLDDGVLLTYRG